MKTLLLLSIVALAASAQSPSFDVASIKPNRSLGGISSIHPSKGRVSMGNVSLKKVMMNAYSIPDDREYMIAGPDWLTTERFDIDATFPGDTTLPQVRQMMQTLLAERFKLTLHKETRQLPMYALTVAKSGPKIHPVDAGDAKTTGQPGHFEATRITMQKLADFIARQAGAPVVDATGLTGVFDFTLEWSPAADLRVSSGDAAAAGDSQGASIFTALQEQLGLRLESSKGPLEVLVVDRMEKTPTEN